MTSSNPTDLYLVPARVRGHRRIADIRVLCARGELDSLTASNLQDDLRHELVGRPAVLAVDLSEVTFLGVAGLDVLQGIQQEAAKSGTALVFTGSARPGVARLLALVGWATTTEPSRSR
jgi:anti-anti-sigma factor